jgi:hypothetical protein
VKGATSISNVRNNLYVIASWTYLTSKRAAQLALFARGDRVSLVSRYHALTEQWRMNFTKAATPSSAEKCRGDIPIG